MSIKRRKTTLLLLVLLTGSFIYYSWFVSVTYISTASNESESINILRYDYDREKKKHNHPNLDQNQRHNDHHQPQHPSFKLNEVQVNSVLQFFYDQQAFLVDVDLLDKILYIQTQSAPLKLDIYENLIKQLNKQNSDKQHQQQQMQQKPRFGAFLSLGIFLDSLTSLSQAISSSDLFKNCLKSELKGSFINDNIILTNIYLKCSNSDADTLTVQVSVFYERSQFLWIGKDNYDEHEQQSSAKVKYFGDVNRAVHKFTLVTLVDEYSNPIRVPANLKKFLFDYEHSKFLECNRDMARRVVDYMGSNYTQNPKRNKMISGVITHISESLESMQKHYFLAGGTLLGWYRDCGIIPHTQDVDIAIWAHEYETKIKKHFLGNKIVRVWGTLGLINDSYEFRLYNDQFTFDMFLVYKYNLTHQWCGYQVNKVKFRRWLPNFDELCSVELLEHKFLVPCDPVGYLNREYGVNNWSTPKVKNYSWTNVVYLANWTDTQWPHTIKYYDKDGHQIKSKMINYINSHMIPGNEIKELPPDDVYV